MCSNSPIKASSLDKLAQLRKMDKNPSVDIDLPTLRKRAKRKYFSSHLSLGLIHYNRVKQETELTALKRQTKRKGRNAPLYISTPESKPTEKSALDIFSFINFKLKQAEKQKFSGSFLNSTHPSRQKAKIQKKSKKIDYFDIQNKDQKLLRSYWNMYNCNRTVFKQGDKVTGQYCKNRLCLVCNSIRTAELIEKYKPVFEDWKDNMYMVTLTVKNCKTELLQETVSEMFKTFTKVKDQLRKKHKKGEIDKFMGLRKFECTSTRRDDYHPHFHILVKGKIPAYALRDLWYNTANKSKIISCQLKTTKGVYLQDVRPAKDKIGKDGKIKSIAKELFKYFTKIISSSSKDKNVYIERLDEIFRVMRGKRVFQTFGFKISDFCLPDQKTDNVSEDIPIEITTLDKHQMSVNRLYKEYFNKIDFGIDRGLATTDLNMELSILEIEHNAMFKEYLPYVLEKEINKKFDLSDRQRQAVLDYICECSCIQSKTVTLNLEDSEQEYVDSVTDTEVQIYKYEYKLGNWFNIYTKEPLIDYIPGLQAREVVKRFKLPYGYGNKIRELLIREQQN